MSALDFTRSLANLAYVVVALSIALGLGFAGGFLVGSEGNLFRVELDNSSISMNGAEGYPCSADLNGNVRCSFIGTNTTWLCSYSRTNESCSIVEVK